MPAAAHDPLALSTHARKKQIARGTVLCVEESTHRTVPRATDQAYSLASGYAHFPLSERIKLS